MTTIVDPDFLTDSAQNIARVGGPNVFINTANRTIRLNNGQNGTEVNGSGALLDEDGVSLQCLYSFLKQQWKDDPRSKNLIAYPFPLVAITPEQFEFSYGWKLSDDSSRDLIRTGGWTEKAEDNTTVNREYLGVISLGNIDGDQNQDGGGDQDKVYYGFFNSTTNAPISGPFNFSFPGEVNQAVKIFENGGANNKTDVLRLFIRQPGKTFDQTDTTDIGITPGTALPTNVQRFPLVEGSDPNITVSDNVIATNGQSGELYDSADNAGPKIRYLDTSVLSNTLGYTKDLDGGPFKFGVEIDATAGDGSGSLTLQQLYSWLHYRLRENGNIEDSAGASKIGKLQDDLVRFVGTALFTNNVTNNDGGGKGVYIKNFASADTNQLSFASDSTYTSANFRTAGDPAIGLTDGNQRSFPFTASGRITFSDEIVNDSATAKFFLYHAYTKEYTGTSIAISKVGAATADPSLDSGQITLVGFGAGTNPLATAEGLDVGVETDRYFVLNGMSTSGNNGPILKITAENATGDPTVFQFNTLDDITIVDNAASAGATLRTHPINSPGSLLVDSAGTAVENTGGITSTLASANLTGTNNNQFVFSYDFDGNTQKDRPSGSTAPATNVVIRALGLKSGSWVELGSINIARVDENNYSVVSAIERNYANP